MDTQEPQTDKQPTHIRDLVVDPANRRMHNPRNIGMVADSLQSVGAARSIVIDEKNEVLAGNGVIDAAGQVGITKVRTIDADGDTIIAVRRKNLTPEQKRTLALFDNRTSELAEWDTEQLRLDVADGVDFSPFFTDAELEDILGADAKPVVPFTIERPADIVWVLIAIPIDAWPKHQATIAAMEVEARYATTVVRPAPDGAGYKGTADVQKD